MRNYSPYNLNQLWLKLKKKFKISPIRFAILLIPERPQRRLILSPVGFRTKYNQPGGFVVEVDDHIDGAKLVRVHGQVSCDVSLCQWSSWGCGTKSYFLLCNVSFLRLKLHRFSRHQWSPVEVFKVEMLSFLTGHQNSCLTKEKDSNSVMNYSTACTLLPFCRIGILMIY